MTSRSPLERLASPGNVLAKEPPDAKEFDGLVRSGLARLKDAENDVNSLESRFDLAYGAAHALCLAAVPLEGDHVLEAGAGWDCDRRVGLARVLVADVLDEEQDEDVVLVLTGVHAAAQRVAAGPEG
jgi:hypothetical protein